MIKSVKDLKAYEDVFTLIDDCHKSEIIVYLCRQNNFK